MHQEIKSLDIREVYASVFRPVERMMLMLFNKMFFRFNLFSHDSLRQTYIGDDKIPH